MKLTYTRQMQEQDSLWSDDGEDFEIMEGLHKLIIAEAKMQGFKGFSVTQNYGDGVFTEIYESEEAYNDLDSTGIGIDKYGTCASIIEFLEKKTIKQEKADSRLDAVQILNSEQADYLTNNYMDENQKDVLYGKYLKVEDGLIVAFDNRTGDCWVEGFETMLSALLWLDAVTGKEFKLKEILSEKEQRLVYAELEETEYDCILEGGWLTDVSTEEKKEEAVFYQSLSRELKKAYARIVSKKFAKNIIETGTMEDLYAYEIENIPF